jgi:hypothetical protein
METLQQQDMNRYNILGLRAICSLNRDLLSSFHLMTRKELENQIINILNNNHIIYIPICISNNKDYFKKYPK